MATPALTQLDLERRIGPQRLAQLCDDDRDNVADVGVVEEVIQEASDRGYGLLLRGFTLSEAEQLVAADAAAKGAFVHIALGLCGLRRPEFMGPDGKPLYWQVMQAGLQTLRDIGSKKERLSAEEQVGRNRQLGTRTSGRAVPATFTFAKSKTDLKGPGGF